MNQTQPPPARLPEAGVKRDIRNLAKADNVRARFAEVLNNRAPQFLSSVISVADSLPANTDAMSVLGSAMTAAVLDLPVDKNLGFAWIVPYKGKAQFQMGYKGYIQLAIRSGQYRFINVVDVYEGELVSVDKLTSEVKLDPAKRASDKVVGYAAYFKTVNGFEHAEYWTKEAVEAHARRFSQSFRSGYDSPWKSDFDSMGRKTVIKSLLSHWGILSVEMQRSLSRDQAVVSSIDPDAAVDFPDGTTSPVENEEAGPKRKKASEAVVEVATVPVTPTAATEPADEVPGAEVPPVATAPAPAAPAPATGTNIQKLEKLLTDGGYTFDHLKQYCTDVTGAEKVADMTELGEVTEEIAAIIIKLPKRLNHALASIKRGA